MGSSLLKVRGTMPFGRRSGQAGGQVPRRRRLVAIVSTVALMVPALLASGAASPAAAATGAPLYRINAGGPTLSDPGGDFIGVGRSNPTAPGVTLTNSSDAADVTVTDTIDLSQVDPSLPEALFQSLARTNTTAGNQMNWAFTVPTGSYEVRLHWAEHQSSTINAIGGRVFDVALEGNLALDNYDMLANTNPPSTKSQAITETLPGIAVTDGTLNLDITAVTSVAIIRGIEILPETGGGNSAPTISATPNPATAVAGQTSVVNLTTNDINGDPVTTQITSGPGFASLVGGNLQLSPGAGDVAGSPYTVTVQASDGTDTSSVNVTVNVIAAGAYLYRINAGGEDVGGYTGITSAPGTVPGFTLSGNIGGTVDIRDDNTIPDTVDLSHVDPTLPEAIFQTTLYATQNTTGYNWDFNVPNGTYEVDLHWMEHNFATITDVGQRLIDVSAEGNLVINDLDELATGMALAGSSDPADGYNVAFTTPVEVEVNDGVLNILIAPVVSVANLRAIDVRPVGTPNDPPTISADPNPVTVTAGETAVVGLTTGDPNGDTVTTQITAGPGFASLVGGDLQLSPSAGDVAGSPYTVTVEASDGTDTTSVDVTVNVVPPVPTEGAVFGDFTGDGTADFAVYRPSNSRWFITGIAGSTQWGKNGDVAVPGDYNGDGTVDIAVYRPSNGRWFVNGVAGSTPWGKSGDIAVPGDYNGDGTTDFAVYRPSNSRWYVNGIAGSTQWGKNGDVVAPGDYNGDGTTDIAIFRPSNGRWYVNGIAGSTPWGKNGDVAVPGDYNGDGTTDFAVYRPSNSRWYVNGIAGSTQWGKSGDVTVPADYNGDGSTDIAIFRPSNGTWYVNGIAGSTQWGQNGDVPVTQPVGSL